MSIKTITIPDDAAEGVGRTLDGVDFENALAAYLNLLKETDSEVVAIGACRQGGSVFNVVDYLDAAPGAELAEVAVHLIADEADLRAKLVGRTAVSYAEFLVNGKLKNVLVSRAGRSVTWRGGMSTFGGPKDTGMSPTEGLAIVTNSDIANHAEVAALFLNPAAGALGRNLNSDGTHYIACRWNYKVTPRKYLLKTPVIVRNPVTGVAFAARPVDWGPAAWTNRIADLSDKLAADLGLKTDMECEVIVPLPADAVPIAAPAAGTTAGRLAAIATQQHKLYAGIHEEHEPLRSRIKGYWDDLQAEAGGGFAFPGVGEAWSAVFVCWCLQQAGVSHGDFGFHPRHAVYVKAAIARATANPQGKYPALRIGDYAPQPGDIIHNNRQGSGQTYDSAAGNGNYMSHCAIVVALGSNAKGRVAIAVGGNEGQSVGSTEVPLDDQGKIRDTPTGHCISVIKIS